MPVGSHDPAQTITRGFSRFGHPPHQSVDPRASSVGGSAEVIHHHFIQGDSRLPYGSLRFIERGSSEDL